MVGSAGVGVVNGDGSWVIEHGDGRSGGEPEAESAPFLRQWRAFRAAVVDGTPPDPDLATVERALVAIEAAYASRVPA